MYIGILLQIMLPFWCLHANVSEITNNLYYVYLTQMSHEPRGVSNYQQHVCKSLFTLSSISQPRYRSFVMAIHQCMVDPLTKGQNAENLFM